MVVVVDSTALSLAVVMMSADTSVRDASLHAVWGGIRGQVPPGLLVCRTAAEELCEGRLTSVSKATACCSPSTPRTSGHLDLVQPINKTHSH